MLAIPVALQVLCPVAVHAASSLVLRQTITALTTTQIDSYNPYGYFAAVGNCPSSQTIAWDCGANCEANPHFKPVASGGDGDSVQYWYVGYDPDLSTVIVAHQGTNSSEILPLLADVDIFLRNLDSTLFPAISPDIQVHSGFKEEQAKTAAGVLSAVQTTMNTHNTTSVTMVGHSLGAALSLLDSVYLPLHLPSGTTFKTVCFGLPRVGNQAFVNYVDANLHLTHINNKEDPIPICPGMFLGFHHPAGEVHIEDSGKWTACPGQDNPSTQCTVGDVPSIFVGNLNDHIGPYNGIMMYC